MTLAKPREHSLSKKLRRFAAKADTTDAMNLRAAAARLDQTIASLGIWKDPQRIVTTLAYSEADRVGRMWEQAHGGG